MLLVFLILRVSGRFSFLLNFLPIIKEHLLRTGCFSRIQSMIEKTLAVNKGCTLWQKP